jgi:hypothetical protein
VPEFDENKPRVMSPDGRRMLVFGNYGATNKIDKVARPPSILDLQTGKQIAVLGKTAQPIRSAFWSKNGKTLVTSSDPYAAYGANVKSVEVSFWDGETFAYKSSLPSDKISWSYLTVDGDRCFYSVGAARHIPLVAKYIADTGAPINVWDIDAGKIEQTISAHHGSVERKIRRVDVSPDGKFLALVVQPPKTNSTERRLVVREIDKSNSSRYEISSKYELKPTPKIPESGVSFSPDGRYFSLVADKNLQIYETATGEKRLEVPNSGNYGGWLNGETFYNDYNTRMEAFDLTTGRRLYEQKLIYDSYENIHIASDGLNLGSETIVVDKTTIVAHPTGTMFLTYSNQYVKVFDSRTGELLQTLISPPMDYSKKKPKLSDKSLVHQADWSDDGKTLYVINADGTSIELWNLLDN